MLHGRAPVKQAQRALCCHEHLEDHRVDVPWWLYFMSSMMLLYAIVIAILYVYP